MEIIVLTDKQSYKSLIPGVNKIYSPDSDLISLLETQLFLNQHKHIGLFLLKDNLPTLHQLPMRIVQRLLDRNDGNVQLHVNHGSGIELSHDVDLVEIFSNFQVGLKYQLAQGQSLHYSFKYWEIMIELTIANIEPKLSSFQSLIQGYANFQHSLAPSLDEIAANYKQIEIINKIILYIDRYNYKNFLQWADSGLETKTTSEHNPDNIMLSHDYLALKQQIIHERNIFRDKIKMLENVLGESLNISKLLEEEDQEQKKQLKRLKQKFENIKNIDTVLFEQQKHIQAKQLQLKSQKGKKQQIRCQNARKYALLKREIIGLEKEVNNMMFTLGCLKQESAKGNKSLQAEQHVKSVLETEVQKFRNNLNLSNKIQPKQQSASSFLNTTNNKQQLSLTTSSMHRQTKPASMHHSIKYYQDSMRDKYFQSMNKKSKDLKPRSTNDQMMSNCLSGKSIDLMCEGGQKQMPKQEVESRQRKREIVRLQELLVKQYEYYQYCQAISEQMQKRISYREPVPRGTTLQSSFTMSEFPILQHMVDENIDYRSLVLLSTNKQAVHKDQLNYSKGASQKQLMTEIRAKMHEKQSRR